MPKEQKTQQSPGFGFIIVPHDGQSQKNWQEFVGISKSACTPPHWGQVSVDLSWISAIGL